MRCQRGVFQRRVGSQGPLLEARFQEASLGEAVMIDGQDRAGATAEAPPDTLGIDPPIHLEAVAWQAGIQAIQHFTIFGTQVGAADRSEAGNVEVGIPAQQWIVSPGDTVESLFTDHLPLGAFEGKADPCERQSGCTASRWEWCF